MVNLREYILKEEETKESRGSLQRVKKYLTFLKNIENSAEYIRAKKLLSEKDLFFDDTGAIRITGHASNKDFRLRAGDDLKLKRVIENFYPRVSIGTTNFEEQLQRNIKVIDALSAVSELIELINYKKVSGDAGVLKDIQKTLKKILPENAYEKLAENVEAVSNTKKNDPNSPNEFSMLGALKRYYSKGGEAKLKKELYSDGDKSATKYVSRFSGLGRYKSEDSSGKSTQDDSDDETDDDETENSYDDESSDTSKDSGEDVGSDEKNKSDRKSQKIEKEVDISKKNLTEPEELKMKSYFGVSFEEAENEFFTLKKLSDTNNLLTQFKESTPNSVFSFSLEDIDKKINEIKKEYEEKDWKSDKRKLKTAKYGGSKVVGKVYTKFRDTDKLKKDLEIEEDFKSWKIDRQTKKLGTDAKKIVNLKSEEIISNIDKIIQQKKEDTIKKAQKLISLYQSDIKKNLEVANKKIQKYRNVSKVIKNFNKDEYIRNLGLSLNLVKGDLNTLIKRLSELLWDYRETTFTAINKIEDLKKSIKEKLSNEKDYGVRKNIATENLSSKIEKEAEKEAEKEKDETAKKSAEELKKDRTDEKRQTEGIKKILNKKEAEKEKEKREKKEKEKEDALKNYVSDYNKKKYEKSSKEYFNKDPETGLPLDIDSINKQNNAMSERAKKNLISVGKATQEIAKALMGIQKTINKKTPKKAQNVVIGNGLNKNQTYSKDYSATSTPNQKMASLYFKEEYLKEDEEIKNLTAQIFTPYKNTNDKIIIALNKATNSSDSKSIINSLKEVSSVINSSERPKLTIPTYAKKMLNSIISISDKLENLGDNNEIDGKDYLICVKILKSLNNFVEMAIIGFKEEVLKSNKVSDSIPENSKPALTTKKINKDENLNNKESEDESEDEPEDEPEDESGADKEDEPKNLLDLAKKKIKASK